MSNPGIIAGAGVCLLLPVILLYLALPRMLEFRAAQLRERGADRKAMRLLEWALRSRSSRNGSDSIQAARVRTEMARVLIQQDRLSEATEELRTAAKSITGFQGKPSESLVAALMGLAEAALEAGWHSEAARICGQTLPLAKRLLRGTDPQLARLDALIGNVYAGLGELETAYTHYEKALDKFRLSLGEETDECADVLTSMAAAMLREERWAEARETGVKAVEILDQTGGAALPRALSVLAQLHAERGNLSEAESLRVSVCQLWERLGGPMSASLAREYESRAELLSQMQRITEAGHLRGKAARIRESLVTAGEVRA